MILTESTLFRKKPDSSVQLEAMGGHGPHRTRPCGFWVNLDPDLL